MHGIQKVEKWKYRGTLYDSIGKVREEIENELGSLIDNIDVVLGPRERLAILKNLERYREEFQYLLGFLNESYEIGED